MEARILRLTLSGQPVEWLSWQSAVTLHSRELVVWTLGGIAREVNGGTNRVTGSTSRIQVPAIIACRGSKTPKLRTNPLLTNAALFARDGHRCMYCGHHYRYEELSRDHVVPRSRGGNDRWENVVAACRRCNEHKGQRLLDETDMELLALPYRPNFAEYLALINSRRIRGDQMEFLRTQFSKNSRMLQ